MKYSISHGSRPASSAALFRMLPAVYIVSYSLSTPYSPLRSLAGSATRRTQSHRARKASISGEALSGENSRGRASISRSMSWNMLLKMERYRYVKS